MNDNPSEEFDDRPWTEEQWEKAMRESDVRSAKFGELLETLLDHPDRDAIIGREMGWDFLLNEEADEFEGDEDVSEDESLDLISDEAAFVDERESDALFGGDPSEPEWDVEYPDEESMQQVRESHDELERLAVYAQSRGWAMKVWKALEKQPAQEGSEWEELLREAIGGSMRVGAKIAGGHGMGYDDEALCGNIVCCRRALEAAEESLRALEELTTAGPIPAETLDPLIHEGRQIQSLVEERIAELRSQVWWE